MKLWSVENFVKAEQQLWDTVLQFRHNLPSLHFNVLFQHFMFLKHVALSKMVFSFHPTENWQLPNMSLCFVASKWNIKTTFVCKHCIFAPKVLWAWQTTEWNNLSIKWEKLKSMGIFFLSEPGTTQFLNWEKLHSCSITHLPPWQHPLSVKSNFTYFKSKVVLVLLAVHSFEKTLPWRLFQVINQPSSNFIDILF